jgi:hypothetical protein
MILFVFYVESVKEKVWWELEVGSWKSEAESCEVLSLFYQINKQQD